MLGSGIPCAAVCSEKPTVLLDESTAATHLIAQKNPELPINMSWEGLATPVVLRLTVDRRGKICDIAPLTGPPELAKVAVATVKKHWRYRPFRVNWKPVVVQFPVTVRFVPRRCTPGRIVV